MPSRLFPALLLLVACSSSHIRAQSKDSQRETLLTRVSGNPSNAPGMTLTTIVAEYKPGASTPPHHHGNAFVMVYVLEGTIISKIDDGKQTVLRAGDNFSEAPHAHHVLFRNPSKTESAKVLAVFLAPTNEVDKDLAILDK